MLFQFKSLAGFFWHCESIDEFLIPHYFQLHQLTQMYVNALGVEFLQTVSKFIKRKKIISYILHKTSN